METQAPVQTLNKSCNEIGSAWHDKLRLTESISAFDFSPHTSNYTRFERNACEIAVFRNESIRMRIQLLWRESSAPLKTAFYLAKLSFICSQRAKAGNNFATCTQKCILLPARKSRQRFFFFPSNQKQNIWLAKRLSPFLALSTNLIAELFMCVFVCVCVLLFNMYICMHANGVCTWAELSWAFFFCLYAAFIYKLRFACCIFYYSLCPPRGVYMYPSICIVSQLVSFVKYLRDFSKKLFKICRHLTKNPQMDWLMTAAELKWCEYNDGWVC